MNTWAPLMQWQTQQQQLQAAAQQQEAERRRRAQVLQQMQMLAQQNAPPQQLYSAAMADPTLAKEFGLPGLLQLSKPQAPYSSIGKLQADLQAGRITPDQYKQQIAIMNKPQVSVQNIPAPPQGFTYNNPQSPAEGVSRIPGTQFPQASATMAGYANRMVKADQALDTLSKQGVNPSTWGMYLSQSMPGGGYMLDPGQQAYQQAQADWVRAKLRKESGAVISNSEMASEIRTYFPQPGDSAKVIEQKAQARKTAEENLIQESQGAYQSMFGQTPATDPVVDRIQSAGKTYYRHQSGRWSSD